MGAQQARGEDPGDRPGHGGAGSGRFVDAKDVARDDAPPAFDLVVIDEPIWRNLMHGLDEPLTEISEADLAGLEERIRTKTCPASPRQATAPGDKDEAEDEGESAWLRDFLATGPHGLRPEPPTMSGTRRRGGRGGPACCTPSGGGC
jgi:hypothetical protein